MDGMQKHAPVSSLVILLIAMSSAHAQVPDFPRLERTRTWEFSGGLQAIRSERVKFSGGSTVDVEDDIGFGFNFGWNFDDHWQLGGEVFFSSVDYDATLVSAETPPLAPVFISNDLDIATLGVSGIYHVLTGPLTPYLSAGFGWTNIDTNILEGPPEVGCWWDPWFGHVCAPFNDTITEDALSWSLGAGVRWDIKPSFFIRAGYDRRWYDIDHATGTPDFGILRFELGTRY